MKVKELIKILEKQDPDKLVVLSKDSEGNWYSTLSHCDDNAVFDKQYGEVHLEKLTPSLKKQGFTEEDLGEGEKAIILYP